MTYGQLRLFIDKMTEDQKKMPVVVAIENEFIEMGIILHVDHNSDAEGMAVGQPILT
jgi:hypothetical protein